MKTLAAELAYFLQGRVRQNLKFLAGYGAFLLSLILIYAWIFDVLMLRLEGRHFSIISGIYWTITAMTTLGYGDITFQSDGGRAFSALVTLSGVVFLLVFLPFGLITLFLAPWLEERLRYRPPAQLPEEFQDHVLIAGWDPLARTFVAGLQARGIPYAVLEADYDTALRLDEQRIQVVHGIPTDPLTLRNARVEKARAVVANMTDTENVNLILTVRSLCPVPVITLLDNPGRRTFMELAGAQEVVPLKEVLGRYLAVRSTTRGAFAHVVDSYGELMFAELPLHGCDLVGRTLEASRIREATGVSVIGVWERGRLLPPDPETVLEEGAVLLFAGTAEQLETLEQMAGAADGADRVLILGHGTVGRSAVAFLEKNNVEYRVVDLAAPADVPDHLVTVGDATNEETLNAAGIMEARSAIVTTNDDGANVFLTLVCRQLNPALRLVARANREENVAELYAAGADFVVSLVSVGATILLNILEGKESTFLTEGVYIFWRQVPDSLDGRTVAQAQLRTRTGATLVAVGGAEDEPLVQGGPDLVLRTGMSLLLVGPPEAEERFSKVLRR